MGESVETHKYAEYLQKAEDFYKLMKTALESNNWNGAGLAAIHCAISAVDALTVYYLGKKHTGQKHEDAATLLVETKVADATSKRKQFLEVIRIKNRVEYEARLLNQADAEKAALQAERLFLWTKKLLSD